MVAIRAAAVMVLGAAVALVVAGCASGGSAATDVTVTMHFSRFDPAEIVVPAGEPITMTLRNDDPIEHEWIVGTAAVHAAHRFGTEPYHDEIPTEVTLRPFETKVTTVTFDEPGEYLYVCHLPGHEEYGMAGVMRVVER